jgi:hypothetical protein
MTLPNDLEVRLREAAISRETISFDEYGARKAAALLGHQAKLISEAADVLALQAEMIAVGPSASLLEHPAPAGSDAEELLKEAGEVLTDAREKMWTYGFSEDDLQPIRRLIAKLEGRANG